MSQETKSFNAEVQKVLDLMIHSVYSNKEVFLRELISNAADAIDKRKFQALSDTSLQAKDNDYKIEIQRNPETKQLIISDNGIGMSYDEVVENIGTIAHSGTKKFFQMNEEMKENPELIGQFGVGFYSSFMVGKKLSLLTRKAGSEEATLWESIGDGNYSIQKTEKSEPGTLITIDLKEDLDKDYCDQWTIKQIVQKYSDFIPYPIEMEMESSEPEKDEEGKIIEGKWKTTKKIEVLNSQKALWTRSPQDVKTEEYEEFYRQLSGDWNPPLKSIHYRAEGSIEFSSLLFLPSKRPFNFNTVDAKWGLQLFVKKVFIMGDCRELLPEYLRFTRGLVDSSDLSLNISREILQQDNQVTAIRKNVVNKILNTLAQLLKKEKNQYIEFWQSFGNVLKEGIATDRENHEKISKLLLYPTTSQDELSSLEDYVSRMKEGQKDIYFLAGENIENLKKSPHLEALKEKGYEVLLMTDDIDEWVVNHLQVFDEKKLVSAANADLDLESEEEKKEIEEKQKKYQEEYKDLLANMSDALKERVKEIRISSRLKNSPVCLVHDQNDMTANMQRILAQHKGDVPDVKRILEINPNHKIFQKMQTADKSAQKEWAELFYGQALLTEGSQVPDPVKFSEQINKLILGE